mmetsp:Transcript_59319/g.167071  ORF Transcript_59319/g.167071 Transcript_59319/m.167071 type:complete len:300 (+) Transcript_59319:905-1804(+)
MSGAAPLRCCVCPRGTCTRSSTQTGQSSSRIVYLYWYMLLFPSCEMRCLEFFCFVGTQPETKSANLCAWLRCAKWKSRPSRESFRDRTLSWASFFRIRCSRKQKVRRCSTFCRTCTMAFIVCGVNDFWHSSHCWLTTWNSTTIVCCSTVELATSFCTVIFTLMRMECSSVQMNDASTSRTSLSIPLILLRHMPSNSRDSGSHLVQGGLRYRPQLRQCGSTTCREIPEMMETSALRHCAQRIVWFGTIGMPQLQQRTVAAPALSIVASCERFIRVQGSRAPARAAGEAGPPDLRRPLEHA